MRLGEAAMLLPIFLHSRRILTRWYESAVDVELLQQQSASLATRGIYIGTSSWKYMGWLGQIYTSENYMYRGKLAKSRFEAGCLQEYARVFSTVCVDAGFYRFPTEPQIARLVSQVTDGFLFSWKVTDEITMRHFPNHARYGDRAGRRNTNFLNAELFQEAFLQPLSYYRDKTGILMFEFSEFHARDFESGQAFFEALDVFLAQLPCDWQYGVEIRNATFLEGCYFDILQKHHVAHVYNSWTRMPPVQEQIDRQGARATDFFAARFLLKPGRVYTDAVEAFSPYTRIHEVNAPARLAIRALTKRNVTRPSYIYVNNRLEGNALSTIQESLGES